MARFSPRALPLAPEVRSERTFTHPAFPEALTISMRYSGGFAATQYVADESDRLFRIYGPGGKVVIPPGEGQPVLVSENLCWMIAVLMVGDVPEASANVRTLKDAAALEIDEPWTFEEWAILAHRAGGAFRDIFDWADGLRQEALGKNAPAAAGESSSAPPSDTDTSTPTS